MWTGSDEKRPSILSSDTGALLPDANPGHAKRSHSEA